MNSIVSSVLEIERGFLYTLKELLVRPAQSIKGYVAGKRVKFYKPFAYVVIMSTITSFLVYLIDLNVHARFGYNYVEIDENTFEYYLALTSIFFTKYQSLFYFCMIPIISICSWLFFVKRFNYWENIVLNTYITAQFNLLIIIAQLTRLFMDGTVSYTPYLIIYFTYIGFVYSRFFTKPDEKSLLTVIKMVILIILIVLIYTTGLSFAGIMSPWW